MRKTQHEDPNEIKVEDLLRLKRSERPDQSFWNEFDRDLHQRMLQALVKKDPWYLQLVRGLSGRIPQAAALASAAVVAMAFVVRPAIVGTVASLDQVASVVKTSVPMPASAPSTQTLESVDSAALGQVDQVVMADYQIDAISASEAVRDAGFERDFGMDVIQVASHEGADYSADSALARATFGNTGVASLVF